MAKRAMSAWKVAGMVLLVVLPGGSLLLLALAAYRAYRQGRGPLVWLSRNELRRAWSSTSATLARWMRIPWHAAANRA